MAPIASAYESFTATLLGTSYNASTGSVNVSVATRYSNTECTEDSCDLSVAVLFRVRAGSSTTGPVIAKAYRETGRSRPILGATFSAPKCSLLPRGYRQTYTIEMVAESPTGEQKSSRTFFTVRSCRS